MTVGPAAGPQQIRAWGPGLEGGIVGKPATFVVESIGTDVGVLGESLITAGLVFNLSDFTRFNLFICQTLKKIYNNI